MPFCPTCRAPVEGEAQFCPRDGTPLLDALPSDPLIGRLLGGRYRLVDRLGQGGMGTVYRALHTLMEKPVAVKVLRSDLAGDPAAAVRFHREARSASRLDHEHCIRVTDFGQADDGVLFLVMELLDGETLSGPISRGPLEPGRAATLAHQICQALAHAHEQGVIHRDLKPDNVFLARRGRREAVKVLDFGLAKIAGDSSGGPAITRAGVVFGTPEYMAPEQAESGTIDARTDLYALGVILYQMLTGGLPFNASSFLALLSKHVEEEPQPPRQRRPDLDIPEELETIALRCLAKDPAARYQSALDVAAALEPFAELARPSSPFPVEDAPSAGTSSARSALSGLSKPERPLAEVSRSERPPPQIDEPVRPPTPSHDPTLAGGEGEGDDLLPAPASQRRWLWPALAGGVVVAALVGGLIGRSPPGKPDPPAPGDGPVAEPLKLAHELIDHGDLDGAARILTAERRRQDGTEVHLLLGEVAQAQGNRLRALAHLHRATRLAPDQPDPHARLAALLALLGQREAACQEARLALRQSPEHPSARATLTVAKCMPSKGAP